MNGKTTDTGPGGDGAVDERAEGEARVEDCLERETVCRRRPVIATRGSRTPCSRVDG